jgi:hypothetical protein
MDLVVIFMWGISRARKMRSTHFGKGIEANNTHCNRQQRTAADEFIIGPIGGSS